MVDVDPDMALPYVLRDDLGRNNPRFGRGLAQCRARTVHLDGVPTRSCVTLTAAAGRRRVTTLAELGTPEAHIGHQRMLDPGCYRCSNCHQAELSPDQCTPF